MSKYKSIDKAFTVWCVAEFEDRFKPWEHQAWHQEGMFKLKSRFIKGVEKIGWKYIEGWHCPACAEVRNDETI